MSEDRPFVDRTQAARMLGVNRNQVTKLINTGTLLTTEAGKPLRSEVESLAKLSQRSFPEMGQAPVLLCPYYPDEGSPGSLFLDPALERDLATLDALNRNLERDGLSRQFGEVPNHRFQGTGPWQVREDKARELALESGLIAGVISGFIREIARVRAYAGIVPYRQRRLFVIESLDREDEHRWLGLRVESMTQTPVFL